MSRWKVLFLIPIGALSLRAQPPELGRTYAGTLDKIIVQTVTICEAGQSITQQVEVRPGTPVTRSRACSGHSVEVSVLDAGLPATLPLGTLERDTTAGPHLRYGTPIETRASARFTLVKTDSSKTNRGYGAFINVPVTDSPSGRFNGACANVSLESSANFNDRVERTLTQSNCQRASQYVAFDPLPNSIAPATLHVITIFNATITIPGEPAPGVSIVFDAIYNMQESTGPDVTIDRMFSVQAVQRVSGTQVPMIPGKATLVRVFPKSVGDNARAVGGVRGLLSADEFPGLFLRPMNTAIAVAGTPDVNQTPHSLNFLLPKEWTLSPRLTLSAQISLGDIAESNTQNNRSAAPLVLEFSKANETRPIVIDYWDVCITYRDERVRESLNIPDGTVVCPSDEADRGDEPLRSILPVDEDRFRYYAFIPRVVWPNGLESYGDAKAFLRFVLTMNRILIKARTSEIIRQNELFQRSEPLPLYRLIPWVPVFPKAEGNSWEQFWLLFPAIAVDHCQRTLRPDSNASGCSALAQHQLAYKFTSKLGAIGNGPLETVDTGFNSGTLSIVRTMQRSRIDQGWINSTDYEGLAVVLRASAANSGDKLERAADESIDTLVLSGSMHVDGSAATLQPAFRFPQSSADASDPNGSWCVRLRRSASSDIESCFEPQPGPEGAESTFVVETPWYFDITRVSLFRRSNPSLEMASLVPGDAPAVSFSSPQAGDVWDGRHIISWSGASRTGDPLIYMLLYSSDGGVTWLPLGVDLKEPRFELDTSQIAGGTGVIFRVMASSGLNSASADVGPVSIRQSPRLALVSSTLDFRNRLAGEVALADVAVRNSGTGPLTVTPSLPAGSPFSFFSRTDQIVIAAGRQHRIRIQYRPLTAGQHRAELRLSGAGATEVVTLTGAAFDRAVPSIDTAASLDFGTLALNTTKDLPLTIRNSGQATLTIQSVTSGSTAYQPLTSSLEIPEGGQADVVIRARLTAPGVLAARLTIRSNDPTVPAIEVALRATGVGETPAAIEVAPASLDFGSVAVNTTRTLDLTIRNRGTAAVTISSVASSNLRFTLVSPSLPFLIPANGQQTAVVRFAPTAAVLETSTLTFTAGTLPIVVELRGTGTGAGGAASILQVDDGTFETTFGFPAGGVTGYVVNRLTPTRYPATLRSVQIYFPPNELPAGTSITVLTGVNASGTGGNSLSSVALQRSPGSVNTIGTFNQYEVTPVTITSGDFIVGFSVTNPRDLYPIATDTSSASRQRSYLGTDPNGLRLLDSVQGSMPGNFGIRARVE